MKKFPIYLVGCLLATTAHGQDAVTPPNAVGSRDQQDIGRVLVTGQRIDDDNNVLASPSTNNSAYGGERRDILDALRAKYAGRTQIMLQTNGDLLTGRILDEIIARGVTRFDSASIDRFHKNAGSRRAEIEALFRSRGMSGDNPDPLIEKETFLKRESVSYGFWGANEEMWLGGNWARGRAFLNRIWLRNPEHNFCAILSGGRGFLGGTELPQELSIQLWKINPCCPGTKFPLGDARRERVAAVLARVERSPFFQAINQGEPQEMGETLGLSKAAAQARTAELGNICLYCDEFFEKLLPPGELPAESRQSLLPLPSPACGDRPATV